MVDFGYRVAFPSPTAPRLPVGACIPGSSRVGNLNRRFEVSGLSPVNSDELATEQQRGAMTWLSCNPGHRTPLVPKLLGIGTTISDCVRPAAARIFSLHVRRFRVNRSGISAVGSDPAVPNPDIWIFLS